MLPVLVLPAASSYTCDHGFIEAATLQYSYQEVDFVFLISAWYALLASIYVAFLLSLSASSCLVLRYNLVLTFTFFRITVRPTVHHGTDFFVLLLLTVCECFKVLLHAVWMASSINSIFCSRSFPVSITVDRKLSISSTSPSYLSCWPFFAFLVISFGQIPVTFLPW